MHAHMITRQTEFCCPDDAAAAGTLADLERLQGKQIRQLELRLDGNQQA